MITIDKAKIGRGVYFRGDDPCCLIGHMIKALGGQSDYMLKKDTLPTPLHFLIDEYGDYTPAWDLITHASDTERYDEALAVFKLNGIDITLV